MYRELGFVALRLICHGPAINASLLQWSKSLCPVASVGLGVCTPPEHRGMCPRLPGSDRERGVARQLGCMRGIPSWAAFVAAACAAVGLHAWHSTNTPETECSMSLCVHVASRCGHPAPQKRLNESPAAHSSAAPSACAAFGQWKADCAAGPHTRRVDGRLQRSKAA